MLIVPEYAELSHCCYQELFQHFTISVSHSDRDQRRLCIINLVS